MKKIFIKKTLSDLIHEQNKLIEKLLTTKTSDSDGEIVDKFKNFLNSLLISNLKNEPLKEENQEIIQEETEDFSFTECDEDIPFIPKGKTGDVKFASLNIEKKELDTNSIDKLKQAMKKGD